MNVRERLESIHFIYQLEAVFVQNISARTLHIPGNTPRYTANTSRTTDPAVVGKVCEVQDTNNEQEPLKIKRQ